LTGVQPITSISWRVTVRDVSDVVTGGVRCVTGGVLIGIVAYLRGL
jgi:hypothetical protein